MKQTAERNLEVKYYEEEGRENIWVAVSHMMEEEHDITVTTEIDMEHKVIVNAKIEFDRYPLPGCKLMEKKAGLLAGMAIDSSFFRNVTKFLIGPEGCPNILTLLNISIPGIMYYYYPYKIKKGEMTQDQFVDILRTEEKNACLAHTIRFSDNN
jgi:hypothetical protein